MKFTSITEVYSKWPNQAACIAHLEKIRWGDEKPICPYCTASTTAKHADRSRWQCWGCNKSFSVTVGTIFHNTHIDLQKWFLLISLMFSAAKGLSSLQASRVIEVRQPTVWSMMHRIRAAMRDDKKLLSGIVEKISKKSL
jgi:transposase-like protein